jgi:hypothetical protein
MWVQLRSCMIRTIAKDCSLGVAAALVLASSWSETDWQAGRPAVPRPVTVQRARMKPIMQRLSLDRSCCRMLLHWLAVQDISQCGAAGTLCARCTVQHSSIGQSQALLIIWIDTCHCCCLQEYSDYSGKFGAAAFGVLAALAAVATRRRRLAWTQH